MSRFLLSTVIVSLCLIRCGKEPAPVQAPRKVRAVQVKAMDTSETEVFSGITQSGNKMNLSFRVPGRLAQVRVKAGQNVQRGELVAALDKRDLELARNQCIAGLRLAKAEQLRAQANDARIARLYENHNAAKSDLDNAHAAKSAADAQVEAAEAALESANVRLSYCDLHSPVQGTVVSVNAEPNEVIDSGRPVLSLSPDGRLEMRFAVPERLVSRLIHDQPAQVRFSSLPESSFRGRLIELGIEPEARTNTYPMVLLLNEADNRLRAGMAGEVIISLNKTKGGTVIPAFAVLDEGGTPFVWVLRKSASDRATVILRPVEVGMIVNDGLQITSGLEVGEWVVTAGSSRIEEGLEVSFAWPGED